MTINTPFQPVTRKPVTVEAFELTQEFFDSMMLEDTVIFQSKEFPVYKTIAEIEIGGYALIAKYDTLANAREDKYFLVQTLEDIKMQTESGTITYKHRAEIGDWLVKGVEGEIYACKPTIFHKTYMLGATYVQPEEHVCKCGGKCNDKC